MKGNLFLRFTAFVWTLILLVPVNQAAASASSWGLSSLFGGPEAVEPTGDKKWSSMLDVDPSKIISLMTRYGGLLIPKSAEKDVEVFSKVCHAESVKLNVIQRKLLVENFTVRLPGKEDALKIGRLFLRWDSYRKPCIEIEVDDVAITVEFLNVMLTKNNWNDLKKAGFPPEFPEEDPKKKSTVTSSFVRIGSIDLSGAITADLKSKPLKKDIATIKWNLDAFDVLDKEIRKLSKKNKAELGRAGCTTDELYALIQTYFGRKLGEFLKATMVDLSQGGKGMTKTFSKLTGSAKQTALKYANDAGEWTGENINDKLAEQLGAWGQSIDKFDDVQKPFLETIASRFNATKVSQASEAFKRIQDQFKSD